MASSSDHNVRSLWSNVQLTGGIGDARKSGYGGRRDLEVETLFGELQNLSNSPCQECISIATFT